MPISNRYKNRFYIDGVQVYADYTKSTAKQYERSDKRVFYRESLTGRLTLLRSDFKKVINQDLDHEFDFRLDRWAGTAYEERYIEGKFFKTDAKFSEDRRILDFSVKTTDRYEKVLTSIDKEFDLVHDLEPPLNTVHYVKQPLLQIAFWRTPYLVNIIGNTSYVLEVPNLPGGPLEDFGFRGAQNDDSTPRFGYIPGTNDMEVDVSGVYVVAAPSGTFYVRADGNFRIMNEDQGGGVMQWCIRGINDFASLGVVYRIPATDVPLFESNDDDHTFGGSQIFESETTDSVCKFFQTTQYVRILTDNETVGGNPTLPLPPEGDDIGGYTFGYDNYVDPSNDDLLQFLILPDDTHTTVPTEYGKFAEDALHFAGEYFAPLLYLGQTVYPLAQIAWREYSLWGVKQPDVQALIDDASTALTCKHAYELGDVIKYVLRAIDPAIVWESDVFHSEFLYKTENPLTGTAYGLTHFITAKTNITIADYDDPAKRGIITFGDLEQLLLAANLYWWIDKQNHFRVEHIHYFNNGRSYTQEIISNNLTVQQEPKNQKPWAYRTKQYEYKKESLPERIDFNWMDEVSSTFQGKPIEIISKFVEQGNIETIRVNRFTSDIDYGQSVPEKISDDGFYIMAATFADDTYTIQFEDLIIPGVLTNKVQNGFWSFPFLQHNFHRHNLPAPDVKINSLVTTATTTKRAKSQEISYPSPLEPDTMRLIVTSLGVAQIESLEVPLITREAKMKVLLPLDFENPMFE